MTAVIDRLARLSRDCELATGIPKEVTAAQAILEAGWNLESAPGNNCFGIKANANIGIKANANIGNGRQLLRTREWLDEGQLRAFLAGWAGRKATPMQPLQVDARHRTLYWVQDWFATFASLEDCFAYRAQLLLKSPIYRKATARFKAIKNPSPADVDAYVESIAKHYSTTDPDEYADEIRKISFGPALTRAFERLSSVDAV